MFFRVVDQMVPVYLVALKFVAQYRRAVERKYLPYQSAVLGHFHYCSVSWRFADVYLAYLVGYEPFYPMICKKGYRKE